MKTIFLRALDAADKSSALRDASNERPAQGVQRFNVDLEDFAVIPGSPFAYWTGEGLRELFAKLPPFEADGRIARKGLTTSDDARYVRTWWEPARDSLGSSWVSYAKGGEANVFHSDLACVVRWDWSQRTIPGYIGRPGRESPTVECAELMGSPGLTWPLRAGSFSPSVFPSDSVFSARGYVIQAPEQDLMGLLGLTSSAAFDALFKMCLGRVGHPEFIVGILQRLPFPAMDNATRERLSTLALRAWSLRYSLDTAVENSHAFVLPALMQVSGNSLRTRAEAWLEKVNATKATVAEIRASIDDICFRAYGIGDGDRLAIVKGFGSNDETGDAPDGEDAVLAEDEAKENGANDQGEDLHRLCANLVSWGMGIAVGRFDLGLATGSRALPSPPAPFGPLPARSPGMLVEPDKSSGILVNDPGHPRDVISVLRGIFEQAFGAEADAWLASISSVLSPGDRDLRTWVNDHFFEFHQLMYSKSRRKAPIIWQLSTLSGGYSVWIYAHALTRDSLLQVQTEFVAPKLGYEERQLQSMLTAAVPRKEIERQEELVGELRNLLDEISRVTPLWRPFPDDGIPLNMAPLWRLLPKHKALQKELKSKWDELGSGKCEWSKTAMHLWPERVVPKCLSDRSIAIAHGLEATLWSQSHDGKWVPISGARQAVDQLVRARTTPAVKAALKNLAEAPEINAKPKRSRKLTSA